MSSAPIDLSSPPSSPAYAPSSPAYAPNSPPHDSPPYEPSSPAYMPHSPPHAPSSPAHAAASAAYDEVADHEFYQGVAHAAAAAHGGMVGPAKRRRGQWLQEVTAENKDLKRQVRDYTWRVDAANEDRRSDREYIQELLEEIADLRAENEQLYRWHQEEVERRLFAHQLQQRG